MTSTDVARVVAASSLSTLCWVDPGGEPRARGVVALVREERPALAFTYADEKVARAVGEAATVTLALTEARSTGAGFAPMALTGRPRLVEDPTGDLFLSDLVVQELRRYPPSRTYADSPLLMREHWWYLPRLVVEIDVEAVAPLAASSEARDHLLVVAEGSVPVVRAAGVSQRQDDRLHLALEGAAPAPGRAVLFGQDASFPDLEQWVQWRFVGEWDGASLHAEESPARTGLGRPMGLVQRWRRQRDLQRRCVAAIPRA
jgi:hypothetical protein